MTDARHESALRTEAPREDSGGEGGRGGDASGQSAAGGTAVGASGDGVRGGDAAGRNTGGDAGGGRERSVGRILHSVGAGGRGHVEIRRDALVGGAFVLSIDGADQSHVDLGDPGSLFYDYVRRIGTAIDLLDVPGRPITAVHLGAGGLTLPRYVQATRPDSEQHVVELHGELVDFVTAHLPLPSGTRLTVHPGDAARVVPRLAGVVGTRADLVVSDLYRGTVTPPALRTAGFYAAVAHLLHDDGMLAINVADDDGLPMTRELLAAVKPVLPHILVLGPASVLTAMQAGNTVIVASRSPGLLERAPRFAAAGPHPAAVFTPAELPARPPEPTDGG